MIFTKFIRLFKKREVKSIKVSVLDIDKVQTLDDIKIILKNSNWVIKYRGKLPEELKKYFVEVD